LKTNQEIVKVETKKTKIAETTAENINEKKKKIEMVLVEVKEELKSTKKRQEELQDIIKQQDLQIEKLNKK